MVVEYLRHTYLDASAAVKLVIDEPGTSHILKYFDSNSQFYMTSLCFAEALGVLKRKAANKQITRDGYFNACSDLISFLDDEYIQLDDTLKIGLVTFNEAENVARQYGLDLSDALQIITVKDRFKHWAHESKTVLVTADRALADAGTKEGLRIWNCEDTPKPPGD
jgi:predicted nucleic acid-binding protein